MCRRPMRPGGASMSSSAGGWIGSVEASAIWSSQSRTSLRPAWGFVSIGESIDTTRVFQNPLETPDQIPE
jgi:hypothetical protein